MPTTELEQLSEAYKKPHLRLNSLIYHVNWHGHRSFFDTMHPYYNIFSRKPKEPHKTPFNLYLSLSRVSCGVRVNF
jgi:hypothetical protein